MQRIILHVDFDSFYASVEQQDNPLLRARPLGITATNGRTCIIAASREAKKLGIKSPSRTFDAQKICPTILFTPANFVRYWDISKKFLTICNNYSPTIEIFSLDEVFMDVTLSAPLFGGVNPLIQKLKHQLQKELGEYITASVGVSHNKLLAKLASGLKKPNGVMEITKQSLDEVYSSAKLTDICGIGWRLNKRLNQMGITSLLQLRTVPSSALIAEFGDAEGKHLHNISFGIDDRPVIHYTEREDVKSVGRQYCLPTNEYDGRKTLQNLYELCEEVALKLRRLNKKSKTIGIYLGGETSINTRQTFDQYMNTGKEIYEACLFALKIQTQHDISRFTGIYVRQISIWASGLVDANTIPAPLLPYDQKQQTIVNIVDKINDKFGDHTIRNGFLLYADKLTTVPNGYGSDRYERSKLYEDA